MLPDSCATGEDCKSKLLTGAEPGERRRALCVVIWSSPGLSVESGELPVRLSPDLPTPGIRAARRLLGQEICAGAEVVIFGTGCGRERCIWRGSTGGSVAGADCVGCLCAVTNSAVAGWRSSTATAEERLCKNAFEDGLRVHRC